MNRQRALHLYIFAIGSISILIVLASASQIGPIWSHNPMRWTVTMAGFILLGWALCRQKVYLGDSTTVALDGFGQVATLLILPAPIALVVVGVARVLSEVSLLVQKRRKRRAIFINLGSSVFSCAAGLGAFHLLQGESFIWGHNFSPLLGLPALVGLAVAYHLAGTLVVMVAVTLNSGERPLAIFTQLSKDTVWPEMSLIAIGIVCAALWTFRPILSLLVVVPVFLSVRSFASVARLHQETVDAVLKMAESIDYRDTGTYEHSQRLAEMTGDVARALRLTPEHVAEAVLASRVHDLGKIGITNDILLKPGALSREERTAMEEHPAIGAEILASFSAFQSSVEIVKHHHERWDGNGYPDRIEGTAIPLGSRIISVVDAFDSMTADRPYRRGMSVDDAVERLKNGIGSQFDPTVCATFIQVLIEQGIYLPHERTPELRLVPAEAG
ncbi:MAG: HD-GYP domain-containing protein [Chloroflexota bacterium]|nr:HD-GYP domain-containing protein [Chloroflexota bacterium]